MNSFKLINLKKSLQIKKLGKTEKKVLVALLEQREHPGGFYYPDGNDYVGIAELVYGITEPYRNDLMLKPSVYSTLSSVLNRLFRKGLVKIGRPHRTKKWVTELFFGGEQSSYMKTSFPGLYIETRDETEGYIHLKQWSMSHQKEPRLPERTHKWWMLTDNGRKIADLLKEDV